MCHDTPPHHTIHPHSGTESPYVAEAGLKLSGRSGWPQTWRLPTAAPLVIGLKVCATISGTVQVFNEVIIFSKVLKSNIEIILPMTLSEELLCCCGEPAWLIPSISD